MACPAYTADVVAERELAAGSLRAVLWAYLLTTQGLYLYFPSRSQTQPKLRAFIDFMRRSRSRSGRGKK